MKSSEEIILDAAAIIEERGLDWFNGGTREGPICPEAALNLAATGNALIGTLTRPAAREACVLVASTYSQFMTPDAPYRAWLVSDKAAGSRSVIRTLERFRKAAKLAAQRESACQAPVEDCELELV